jgi:hypothetical protein
MKKILVTIFLLSGTMLSAQQDVILFLAPTGYYQPSNTFRITAVPLTMDTVLYMQVYVDGRKKAESNTRYIDTMISTYPGPHTLTVQYKTADGKFVKWSRGVHTSTPIIAVNSVVPPLVVDQYFSHQFEATGSNGDYTWEVLGGRLPPGVTLTRSGTLWGTPTLAGNWMAKIKTTDSANIAIITEVNFVTTRL